MSKPRWPYAGDMPIARARKIALSYRQVLEKVAPEQCRSLDELFEGWGETWVIPLPVIHDLDAPLTPGQAAQIVHCSTDNIRRLRLAGRLKGQQDEKGHWRYLGRDVLTVISDTRRRTRRA